MHYFGATKRSCFQDECWWGCQIGSRRTQYLELGGVIVANFNPTTGTTDYFSPLVIADLKCLEKCRNENALFETCFGGLLDDVTSTGTDPVTITAANTCNAACTLRQYVGVKTFTKTKKIQPNEFIFTYNFPTNEIQVFEEYLMFGVNDLIGTIGGHSGLFIGFSFYGVISTIFGYFQRKM